MFELFKKKKPVLMEVTVVYTEKDKEAIKAIKEELRDYTYKKETLGLKVEKPEIDEIPTKEEYGIMHIPLDEIMLLNEHEVAHYTLLSLYGGTQILVDYPIQKFREYLRSKGYQVDELKK